MQQEHAIINKVTKTFRAGVGTEPYSGHITGSTNLNTSSAIAFWRGIIIGPLAATQRVKSL